MTVRLESSIFHQLAATLAKLEEEEEEEEDGGEGAEWRLRGAMDT